MKRGIPRSSQNSQEQARLVAKSLKEWRALLDSRPSLAVMLDRIERARRAYEPAEVEMLVEQVMERTTGGGE